jgi:ribosomal-protein-alanine N-acetyltransferase
VKLQGAIRGATRDDGPALATLHAAAFDEPWSADDILRFAEDRGGFALVADADDTPAGFILCRMIAGEAEVLTLAVAPAARRRGIARALLEAAIVLARPTADTMFLEVAADNPGAAALYAGAGFETVGRRAGYYGRAGGSVDALVMRRALNS